MKKLTPDQKIVYLTMGIGGFLVFMTDDVPTTIFGLEFLFFALGYVIWFNWKYAKEHKFDNGIWC